MKRKRSDSAAAAIGTALYRKPYQATSLPIFSATDLMHWESITCARGGPMITARLKE